jgi:uncharacterized repeat protein (TIGR01451 family)
MLKKAATLFAALAVFIAAPLSAQVSPTPENTVITNTVSVTYQDAQGNNYSANAQVSVTVGFLASVDVQSAGTVTPASPTTGNQLTFTIVNDGNGTDQFSITNAVVGAGSGTLTITGYIYDGNSYASLALLNAALSADNVAAGASADVIVVYDVQMPGGTSRNITLTAASVRTPATTDASTTAVTPPVAGGVSITSNTPTISRLPNNSTATWSTTFLVANGANASKTFTLTPTVTGGAAILIGNVVITGGDQLTLAANASATVTVTYIVANVAAGTSTTINLAVADNADPLNVNDTDAHVVTVVKPLLALEKQVYRVDQITAITAADRVLPGEDVYYRLTITNSGTAGATTLSLTDALPAQLQYVSHSVVSGTWAVNFDGGTSTLTATTATLAIGASNVIWIRATVR